MRKFDRQQWAGMQRVNGAVYEKKPEEPPRLRPATPDTVKVWLGLGGKQVTPPNSVISENIMALDAMSADMLDHFNSRRVH